MIKEYKRGEQVSKNFTANELMCKCAKCQERGITYLDDKFVETLQGFRDMVGKAMIITPNGGNRCETWNRQRGGAAKSRHLSLVDGKPKYCDGADFSINGIEPDELAVMAEAFGFNGVGVYAPGNRHIHADTRDGAHICWWLKTSGSNTPGFGGIPVLFKLGNRSPAITKIQRSLFNAGYALKSPDGKGTMDSATVQALKNYQKDNGLSPVDGVFGSGTNAKLKVFDWK